MDVKSFHFYYFHICTLFYHFQIGKIEFYFKLAIIRTKLENQTIKKGLGFSTKK